MHAFPNLIFTSIYNYNSSREHLIPNQSKFWNIGHFRLPFILLLCAANVKGKWVDSNFQIIDLLVQPRAVGVAGTLIFVHIANFATLQSGLHVGSFTCRILIHCIRTSDSYFYVPLRDTELCD